MTAFKKIFSLKNIRSHFQVISSRFPVSIGIIFLGAFGFFSLLHDFFPSRFDENIGKIIISCIITFFFSISVYLSTEAYEKNFLKKNIFQLIPILFGFFLFLTLQEDIDNFENIVFIALSFTGIFFYLFFAPYLRKIFSAHEKQENFYSYFYSIATVFFISFILGWVLFALGSIGISAIFALFDIRDFISEDIYGDWAILSLACITPLFALTKIPQKKTFHTKTFTENIFFSFLIKYITIPFIYLYFIILYTYSIKVLLNFSDWPRGEVSWMVIGFSTLWYLVYIFSFIFQEKNAFISLFRKIFPAVVLPQIFMLFYAIFLRINQYGLTVNRYFVVIFWVWLSIISLYYFFSKKKFLIIIPAFLTLITIIISLGPWSVHQLPQRLQKNLLEKNLIEANILQDGKIIPLENYEDIDEQLSRNIYSEIQYLCNFNNCKVVKEIFPEIYADIVKKWEEQWDMYRNTITTSKEKKSSEEKYVPGKWKIIREITNTIKVENYRSTLEENSREIISFHLDSDAEIFPLEIEGFKKIYYFFSGENYKDAPGGIYMNWETEEIIFTGDNIISPLNISEFLQEILKRYSESNDEYFSKEDFTYETETYTLILEKISLKNPEYTGKGKNLYRRISGYILMK